MWTIFTIPQPCSSLRLVLTLERATASVSTMSSAFNGRGEMNSSAWTWATVRLMPQRVPISPQWRMNFCWTDVSAFIFLQFLLHQKIPNILSLSTSFRQKPDLACFFNVWPVFFNSRLSLVLPQHGGVKTVKSKSPFATSRRKIMVAGVLAVVFVWVSLPARPFRPVEPIPGGIVDMHCHIAGIGAGGSGCFVSPRLQHNWRFKIYLHSFGVTEKEI